MGRVVGQGEVESRSKLRGKGNILLYSKPNMCPPSAFLPLSIPVSLQALTSCKPVIFSECSDIAPATSADMDCWCERHSLT